MANRRNNAYLVPPNFAFVKHPYIKGFWVRAHRSVVLVACPFCKVKKGELCINRGGMVFTFTHGDRRRAANNVHCVRQDGICIDINLI